MADKYCGTTLLTKFIAEVMNDLEPEQTAVSEIINLSSRLLYPQIKYKIKSYNLIFNSMTMLFWKITEYLTNDNELNFEFLLLLDQFF